MKLTKEMASRGCVKGDTWCDLCKKRNPGMDRSIHDFIHSLDPGDEVPVGDCEECGGMVYEVQGVEPEPPPARYLHVVLHHHRHGVDVFLVTSDVANLTVDEAIALFKSEMDLDPEEPDEYVEVVGATAWEDVKFFTRK